MNQKTFIKIFAYAVTLMVAFVIGNGIFRVQPLYGWIFWIGCLFIIGISTIKLINKNQQK